MRWIEAKVYSFTYIAILWEMLFSNPQVVYNCPPLAQRMAECNVVEQVCELLPYLSGTLSQPLHALLRVIVALQTAQPTENRAAAPSTQLAVHFYVRLYAHFVKSEPCTLTACGKLYCIIIIYLAYVSDLINCSHLFFMLSFHWGEIYSPAIRRRPSWLHGRAEAQYP